MRTGAACTAATHSRLIAIPPPTQDPVPSVGASAGLRVVARPVPVDHHDLLVADDPGVVAARQGRDVPGTGDQLGAVVHADRQPAAEVVLEVRRLAALRVRDRPHVVRPPPTGLEDEAADLATANVEDL